MAAVTALTKIGLNRHIRKNAVRVSSGGVKISASLRPLPWGQVTAPCERSWLDYYIISDCHMERNLKGLASMQLAILGIWYLEKVVPFYIAVHIVHFGRAVRVQDVGHHMPASCLNVPSIIGIL